MSKAKMIAARELIKEKKYQEARAILKTIDHKVAKEWLERLDKIAPEQKIKPTGKLSVQYLVIGFMGLALVVVSLFALNNRPSASQPSVKQENPTLQPSTTISTETPRLTATSVPSPTEDMEAIAQIYWREFCIVYFGLSSSDCDSTLYPNNIDEAMECLSEALSPYVRDSHDTFARCVFEHSD